jgi:hypothetical protein
MWYPHNRFANTLNNQGYAYISSFHGVAHFMPHDGMAPCQLPHAKLKKRVLGYFESSPPFLTPGDAQASKATDPRARILTLQVNRPSSPIGP